MNRRRATLAVAVLWVIAIGPLLVVTIWAAWEAL